MATGIKILNYRDFARDLLDYFLQFDIFNFVTYVDSLRINHYQKQGYSAKFLLLHREGAPGVRVATKPAHLAQGILLVDQADCPEITYSGQLKIGPAPKLYPGHEPDDRDAPHEAVRINLNTATICTLAPFPYDFPAKELQMLLITHL